MENRLSFNVFTTNVYFDIEVTCFQICHRLDYYQYVVGRFNVVSGYHDGTDVMN